VNTAPTVPLLLVLGDEELLAARAISAAVDAARADDPGADVREYEAGALTAGELSEMLSPSLFGGRRVLVIRSGQDARKDLVTALLAYAKDPDPEVSLIVAHLGAAKGKAFADGLKAAGAQVAPALKLKGDRERVAFVRDEFRRNGGRCDEAAASALLAAVGNDLREIAAACSQLLADTDGKITPAVVARYYRGRAEVSGFTVADAAMIGDVPGALEALRWALHTGLDPVPIADAIADGVRTVARVAAAGRGNPYSLASTLGMPAWKIQRAQERSRGWTPEGLVDAMRAAADCNAAVKGGGEDRAYALECAVFAVAAARQQPARAMTPGGMAGGAPAVGATAAGGTAAGRSASADAGGGRAGGSRAGGSRAGGGSGAGGSRAGGGSGAGGSGVSGSRASGSGAASGGGAGVRQSSEAPEIGRAGAATRRGGVTR
jgi:DNA polymerase-3 subunit delta